ncbi:MAG: glycoside hydrolase family 108 protein [Pseudomonadota bacterium]
MSDQADIVVTAFGARFLTACDRLLRIEGGYSNDPADRGGATRYGISLRFLKAEGKIDLDGDGIADFDLDFDGDIDGADIRKLSRDDARYLYQRCFWRPLDCDSYPVPLGEALFDQAVNGGLRAAGKLLQSALNDLTSVRRSAPGCPAPLKEDGAIGMRTRAALDWCLQQGGVGMAGVIAAYRRAAADRYRAIVAADPTQQRFLRGWLNRAAELGAM